MNQNESGIPFRTDAAGGIAKSGLPAKGDPNFGSLASAAPVRGLPVLVTGASGFVGHAMCRALADAGLAAIAQIRHGAVPSGTIPLRFDWCSDGDFAAVCPPVSAVVHLAGLSHVPLRAVDREVLRRTNVDTTLALARMAAERDIPLVFASSAKVLGESGAWNDASLPAPADAYAESKLAAEASIRSVPGLKWTILRPPLVYGPGAKGNFLSLLRWADRGFPLPLASLRDPRSLLYVENLASAILACLNAPAAIARTWLISDGPPLGTATLFRLLAEGLGRPARLFPVDPRLLRRVARLAGKGAEAEKLTARFVLEDREIRARLGWKPPHDSRDALAATAAWYRASHSRSVRGAFGKR